VHRDPVITVFGAVRGRPTIPFVGLAESMVLAAFRKAGVSLQHIRQAMPVLKRKVDIEHALASQGLYTHGAVILYDFAQQRPMDDAAEELVGLTRVVDGQRVFTEVVHDYLRRITYVDDGFAEQLVRRTANQSYCGSDRTSGRSSLFVRGRARLDDTVARWKAGDRIAQIADDFEVPADDLEDALRVAVGTGA